MFDYILAEYERKIYQYSPLAVKKAPWIYVVFIFVLVIAFGTLFIPESAQWLLILAFLVCVTGAGFIIAYAIRQDQNRKEALSKEILLNESKKVIALLKESNCYYPKAVDRIIEYCKYEIEEVEKKTQLPNFFLTYAFPLVLSIVSIIFSDSIDMTFVLTIVYIGGVVLLLLYALRSIAKLIDFSSLYTKRNVAIHMKKRLEYIATQLDNDKNVVRRMAYGRSFITKRDLHLQELAAPRGERGKLRL